MFNDMYKNASILRLIFWVAILLVSRELFAQPEEMPASQTIDAPEFVIVHPLVTSQQLSLNELRSIFSLRARKWPDGTAITVFVLRDEHVIHRQFLMHTLKMLPHQLRRQWDRYIYSGIGQGPVVVETPEDMLMAVKSTVGGVGYIEGGVTDESVNILPIK